MYQERRDRLEQGPWGKRTEGEGRVLENQPPCPPPQLPSKTAEIGVSAHWKELTGVPVNSLFALWGSGQGNLLTVSVGSSGEDLKRGMKTLKSHSKEGGGGLLGTGKAELHWGNCFYLPLLTAITHFRDVFSTRTQTKENTIFQHKTWNVAKSSTFHKTEDL